MKTMAGLVLLALTPALAGGIMANQETDAGGAATLQTATFGGGCFWCVEAIFERVAGVDAVVSGYSGGHVPDPDYKQICAGTTGHAEAVQVTFDPARIGFEEILTVFFGTHDPTTLNRQGADAGTQYRSVIFYHDAAQKAAAESVIADLEREGVFRDPIVTEVTAFEKFYPAEDYHQEYYERNSNQPYCQVVIAPKLDKLQKKYADKLE